MRPGVAGFRASDGAEGPRRTPQRTTAFQSCPSLERTGKILKVGIICSACPAGISGTSLGVSVGANHSAGLLLGEGVREKSGDPRPAERVAGPSPGEGVVRENR